MKNSPLFEVPLSLCPLEDAKKPRHVSPAAGQGSQIGVCCTITGCGSTLGAGGRETDRAPACRGSCTVMVPKVIDRPMCPTCGQPMIFVMVEVAQSEHTKHTFHCPECGHFESVVAKVE
jgi:hypothetical protein